MDRMDGSDGLDGMDSSHHGVIGVLGGSGGVGASTFAAILALVASDPVPALLVDVDCAGGGIDVVLGIEQASGARWSGLHVAGGRLDPAELLAGLPSAAGCAVLAADTAEIDPDAVSQVVDAAAGFGTVVLDLPRQHSAARASALAACRLVVVLVRGDVAGLVAAHAMCGGLAPPVGLVVRRGGVEPDEVAALVGAPLLGVLPPLGERGLTVEPQRPPRQLSRVAAGVLRGAGESQALAS